VRSVALLAVFLNEESSVEVTHHVEFDAESFKLLVIFSVKLVLNIELRIALVGGAVYAPVAMIGIQGLALVPKNAAGTVAGFLSLFGYLFGDAILSKIILGRILNQGHFAWNTAFWIFVIGSIISIIVCGIAWNKEKRMMEERMAAALKE
jgi:sugar phosphate permease